MIEILYLLVFVLVSASIGKKILDIFALQLSGLDEFVFSTAVGYGILSYLTLFVGFFGLLYKNVFYVLFLALVIISVKEIKHFLLSLKKIKFFKIAFNFRSFLLIILLLLIFLNLLVTRVPSDSLDVLGSYLAVPKIHIQNHQIVDIPHINNSDYPGAIQMLYLIGLLMRNFILANSIAYSFGVLLLLSIYGFCKKYINKETALLASTIFYWLPLVIQRAQTPKVDLALVLYSFLAIYSLINYYFSRKSSWVVLSAIFSGLVASTKLTGIFFVFVMPLIFVFVMFSHKQNLKKIIFLTSAFFVISMMIVAPWYIKSYVYTGNPVYPYAYNYFGGEYMSKELTDRMSETLKEEGTGRGILRYLLLPWNLAMDESSFESILGPGPIFLIFIPVLFFIKKDKNFNFILSLLGISWLFITIWFFFMPHALRHTLVSFVFLSIVCAYVINQLLNSKYNSIKRITFIMLLFIFLFNFVLWVGALGDGIAVAVGIEAQEEFLAKLKIHDNYKASEYINKNLPENSKIFLFWEYRGFYLDREYVSGSPVASTYIDYRGFRDEDELYARLKEINITHIMVNYGWDHYKFENIPISQKANELMEKLLEKYVVKIYDNDGIAVYELK